MARRRTLEDSKVKSITLQYLSTVLRELVNEDLEDLIDHHGGSEADYQAALRQIDRISEELMRRARKANPNLEVSHTDIPSRSVFDGRY